MVWQIIALASLACFVLALIWGAAQSRSQKDSKQEEPEKNQLLKRQAVLESELNQLKSQVDKLPNKVLDSITSSSNNFKGRLAELIGYMKLNAQYDKVIPFGDITDFIGIRFPDKSEDGSIDFIDVKNGPNAKLTRDQSKFKKLIEAKRINFVKVKVDTKVSDDTSS